MASKQAAQEAGGGDLGTIFCGIFPGVLIIITSLHLCESSGGGQGQLESEVVSSSNVSKARYITIDYLFLYYLHGLVQPRCLFGIDCSVTLKQWYLFHERDSYNN